MSLVDHGMTKKYTALLEAIAEECERRGEVCDELTRRVAVAYLDEIVPAPARQLGISEASTYKTYPGT